MTIWLVIVHIIRVGQEMLLSNDLEMPLSLHSVFYFELVIINLKHKLSHFMYAVTSFVYF